MRAEKRGREKHIMVWSNEQWRGKWNVYVGMKQTMWREKCNAQASMTMTGRQEGGQGHTPWPCRTSRSRGWRLSKFDRRVCHSRAIAKSTRQFDTRQLSRSEGFWRFSRYSILDVGVNEYSFWLRVFKLTVPKTILSPPLHKLCTFYMTESN